LSADAPLPGVRRIVVLRQCRIGDYMFALPALHALRHAYPAAHIVLLGQPWQAALLRDRPGPVDEVVVMPPYPGIGIAPDAPPDPAMPGFIEQMRARRFDLALQMAGGGQYSNPFIRALGARIAIGMAAPGVAPLDRSVPLWPHANHALSLLQVAALAGARPCIPERDFDVTDNDRREAAAVLPLREGERLVVLHPGATDARRRWPAERFAAVADALAERGATVVLSASDDEAAIAHAVAQRMRHPPARLAGKLTLPALCGLLERARMVVANDTGPLHMALAIGTPAVGIFWFTNIAGSGTLRPHLLSPFVSAKVYCPVCGSDARRGPCGHDVSLVDDVDTADVVAGALALYGRD
jgi:ADP-heptose:LPS heptosyltransferase